ncbi:MAG: hypothetical protein IT504_00435, partial [Burkholderiaceae bacterium]|nr:hypothetical protein [Burkholderiaceae bacterium]
MDLMEMTGAILAYGEICDHCLGRMVGKRSFGLSNDQRGNALRVSYALSHDVPFHPHEGTCWICQEVFISTEEWARKIVTELEGIEYRTFLIGTRVP